VSGRGVRGAFVPLDFGHSLLNLLMIVVSTLIIGYQ